MAETGDRTSRMGVRLVPRRRYRVAAEFAGRARDGLAQGRSAEVEADARSVMAAHADTAPAGEPYLTARQNLVFAIGNLGRHREAAQEATGLLDAIIPVFGSRNTKVISLRINRAGQFSALARYDEAEADSLAAIEDSRHLWPNSEADRFGFMAASTHVSLLDRRGLYTEAEALARSTIREAESSKVHHVILAMLRVGLAQSLNGQERYAEAERMMRDLRPDQPHRVVSVRNQLAPAQLGLGLLAEAEATARAAVSEGTQVLSPVHYLTLTAGTLLGSALAFQGKLDEAARQLRENAAAWAEHFGDEHPSAVAAKTELAKISR